MYSLPMVNRPHPAPETPLATPSNFSNQGVIHSAGPSKVLRHEPQNPLSPLQQRILNSLRGASSGIEDNELRHRIGNGKGASPAMVQTALSGLVANNQVGRVNGRWVAVEVRPSP